VSGWQATPEDWRDVSLGDLLGFSNGINADKSAYGTGIPFANVLEVITHESLRECDIPGRIKVPKKIQDRYEVRHGDILFNRTSETQEEVGLSSVYVGKDPIVFGGFVFRGCPRTNSLDVGYSKYALRAKYVRDQVASRGQGGIRANIGQRDLKSVEVSLPTLQEQHAIAEALGDVSDQVGLLKRLIVKKQAIKQAMLQQFLTGKTRLSGFDIPWEEFRLGSLLKRSPRYGVNAAAVPFSVDTYTYIRITDIDDYGHFAPRPKVGVRHSSAESYRLQAGELVFARTGASVGKSYLYNPRDGELVYAGFLINVAPDSRVLEPGFLALVAQTTPYWDWVAQTSVRSGQPGINGREYALMKIKVPEIREQLAIVKVLQDFDADIRMLRDRCKKAEYIKQGMMRQLLTGKTRLPVQGDAAE
jgi:type I restriction enzyme, S subunit